MVEPVLTCCLLSSADNLCKLFEPRSGPIECHACSGPKLFDNLMKDFFEKVDYLENQQTTKKGKSTE